MTPAVPDPTVEARIAEVAWEHRLTTPVQCACGWRETDGVPRLSATSPDRWAAHLAAVLAPILATHTERAVREALEAERALRRGFYEEGYEDGKRETVDYLTRVAENAPKGGRP